MNRKDFLKNKLKNKFFEKICEKNNLFRLRHENAVTIDNLAIGTYFVQDWKKNVSFHNALSSIEWFIQAHQQDVTCLMSSRVPAGAKEKSYRSIANEQ